MDKNYVYTLLCDAIGSLAAVQAMDAPPDVKTIIASVERLLRREVLPEVQNV
jgi:hypothetical protein